MPTTISSNEVSYRGIARKGFSKISLYNEQKQIIAQTTAIGSGSFVFSMPKQVPGSKLTLVATAGAELESRDITVNTTIYVSGFATGGTYRHMQNTQIEGNIIGLKMSELSGMKSVSPDATKATITKLQTLAESKKNRCDRR